MINWLHFGDSKDVTMVYHGFISCATHPFSSFVCSCIFTQIIKAFFLGWVSQLNHLHFWGDFPPCHIFLEWILDTVTVLCFNGNFFTWPNSLDPPLDRRSLHRQGSGIGGIRSRPKDNSRDNSQDSALELAVAMELRHWRCLGWKNRWRCPLIQQPQKRDGGCKGFIGDI